MTLAIYLSFLVHLLILPVLPPQLLFPGLLPEPGDQLRVEAHLLHPGVERTSLFDTFLGCCSRLIAAAAAAAIVRVPEDKLLFSLYAAVDAAALVTAGSGPRCQTGLNLRGGQTHSM